MAYQNMPSYRKPTSFILKETYPLPPYSSVIGMIHAACGFETYMDMDVSIQGNHYSTTSEIYTKYEFGKGTKYEAGRHNIKVQGNEKEYGMIRGVGNVEVLIDVNLCIHIKPHNMDLVDTIKQGLLYPKSYLALGRWEDLLRIDRVDIVELTNTQITKGINLQYDAYIPIETEEAFDENEVNFKGTIYRLNKKYSVDSKTRIRRWDEQIIARYATIGSRINSEELVMLDSDMYPVFLA